MELGKLDRTTVVAAFWRGAAMRLVLGVLFPWMALVLAAEFSLSALVPTLLVGALVLMSVRAIARV